MIKILPFLQKSSGDKKKQKKYNNQPPKRRRQGQLVAGKWRGSFKADGHGLNAG
jgi:hypothetical protein